MSTHTGHTQAIQASRVIGTEVYNLQGERIGTLEDVMLDKLSNSIMFAVVGFGGFLGIGEHHVAVTFSSLNIERDSSALTQRGSFIVRVNATKESLQNAPQWKDPTTAAR